MDGGDKRGDLLVERAESLLLCLKRRFPGLTQSTLDANKIQYNKVNTYLTYYCLFPQIILNTPIFYFFSILTTLAYLTSHFYQHFVNFSTFRKALSVSNYTFTLIMLFLDFESPQDVGKSILESYSRVLESLAFNIVARIEDLLYVDEISRQSDKLPSSPRLSLISHKKANHPVTVPGSGTPYRTASATPNFSPLSLISPSRGERTPFINGNSNKSSRRGLGVKRVLTNYLGGDPKVNGVGSVSNRITEGPTSRLSTEGKESSSIRNESKAQQMDR